MPHATAQQVVLEIIRRAGGELTDQRRLALAFYHAHLVYYAANPGFLSDGWMIHAPTGPGIGDGEKLLGELVDAGLLVIDSGERYRLTPAGMTVEPVTGAPAEAVQQGVDAIQGRSGDELGQEFCQSSRSWRTGQPGEELHIYVDPIPEDEYQETERDLVALQDRLARILGGERGPAHRDSEGYRSPGVQQDGVTPQEAQ